MNSSVCTDDGSYGRKALIPSRFKKFWLEKNRRRLGDLVGVNDEIAADDH